MNREVDQMIHEYVFPFIFMTIILGVFIIIANPGKAIDQEIKFQDEVYNINRK